MPRNGTKSTYNYIFLYFTDDILFHVRYRYFEDANKKEREKKKGKKRNLILLKILFHEKFYDQVSGIIFLIREIYGNNFKNSKD